MMGPILCLIILLIFEHKSNGTLYKSEENNDIGFIRRLLLIRLALNHFQGLVEIDIIPLSYTNKIILHQKSLKILKVELFKRNEEATTKNKIDYFEEDMLNKYGDDIKSSININNVTVDNDLQIITILTDSDFQPNEKMTLRIRYRAEISKKLDGLYKTYYINKDKIKKTIASTQFEPTSARKMFPSFDEPSFKASFTLTIIHDSDLYAISNMPLQYGYPKNLTQYLTVSKFQPSIRMSTYLISLSLIDFISTKSITKLGTTIHIYAPDTQAEYLQYSLNIASNVLTFFEDYFGQSYPLTKLGITFPKPFVIVIIDIVAIPDFMSGAMENVGHLIFRSTNLIYDPTRVPFETKKQIMMIICHELAHQWFGNLVTMKWWNDIWLNEGFANFVEIIGSDFLYPRLDMMGISILNGWTQALEYDSMNSSHSLSQQIDIHLMIDELFDSISYNKGSSILRMLESLLGSGLFLKGIRSYINTYRFSNAETDDLWNSLNEVNKGESNYFTNSGLSIKTVMDTWTKQRGFPLVNVDVHSQHAVISQISYLKAKVENRAKRDQIDPLENIWHIPIEYFKNDYLHEDNFLWLSEKSVTIPMNGLNSWIKLNKNVKGFYIVNYNDMGWESLIKQLKEDHTIFSSVDRAGLIHDSFKLACDGIISPIIPLELINYMDAEKEYIPWAMLRIKYSCFSNFLQNKDTNYAFKSYIWEKQKHLKNITALQHPCSDCQYNTLQQYELYLFALKHNFVPEDKKILRRLYMKLIAKNLVGYEYPEIRTLSILHGFVRNNEREFYTLWKIYLESTSEYDRRLLLKNIATFSKERFTKINLHNSFNTSIVRVQDCLTFLSYVFKYTEVFKESWEYVVSHWPTLNERYANSELADFLLNIISWLNDWKAIYNIVDFLKSENFIDGLFSVKRIHEKIEDKRQNKAFKWLKSHECATEKWLHKYHYLELNTSHYTRCNN